MVMMRMIEVIAVRYQSTPTGYLGFVRPHLLKLNPCIMQSARPTHVHIEPISLAYISEPQITSSSSARTYAHITTFAFGIFTGIMGVRGGRWQTKGRTSLQQLAP